jgi:FAD dependent oxidoreductase
MKIAIIGGGWVGCHLANKLIRDHDITIYEKNSTLFSETSYNNQNRLHLGYHYARSFQTRELCLSTFDRFINDYGFATQIVNKNLYCVAKNTSLLDFTTYLKILDDLNHTEVTHNFQNIEGCINTNEMYINFEKMFEFFNSKFSFQNRKINQNELLKLSEEFDIVINATNNHIVDKTVNNSFYESTISLIYEKKQNFEFGGLTLVDGDLFSIYPYQDNLFTVTDVQHTPIKKFTNIDDLNQFNENSITENFLSETKTKIETKIISFYPEFLNDFEYRKYFISTKSKVETKSDSRYPIITQNGNIINCFTGKIQGIYLIEDYVKKTIDGKITTD